MGSILQWNTRGLVGKFPAFQAIFADKKPAVAALQETHFNDSDNNKFKIQGYSWYRHNVSATVRKGGTAILIENSIPHTQVQLTTSLDCVAVSLTIQHVKLTVISLYISPTVPDPTEQQLTQLFSQITGPMLILGDLNGHHSSWGSVNQSKRGEIIYDALESQNLVILNSGAATRQATHAGQSDTAIDISCCTPRIASMFTWEVEDDPGLSDHFPIKLSLPVGSIDHVQLFSPSWNLKRADWSKFEAEVDHTLTTEGDPDSAEIELILRAISSAAQVAIPKNKAPRKNKDTSWWNAETALAKAQMIRAKKTYQKHVNDHNRDAKNAAIDNFKNTCARVKKESFHSCTSKFNRFTPTAKVWKTIGAFSGKRPSRGPFPQLKVGGQTITDPKEVMDNFADHYSSVADNNSYTQKAKDQAEWSKNNTFLDSPNDEYYNLPFTMVELNYSIGKCKDTAVGPDEIHYSFFRHLSKSALEYLLSAINNMFLGDSFPAAWKESIVIPIPKPGKDKSDPKGYRPISLTSCACKLVERMVNVRLHDVLEHDIDAMQSGFRRGRATTDNLIKIVSDIQNGFYRKHITIGAFLDIKSAFDRVQKSPLMYKLSKLGVQGHLAKFIENFLSDRKFKVRCGTTYSYLASQDQGTPQGSVLSPTLFLVMINDLFDKKPPPGVNYSLFADDVAIWKTTPIDTRLKEEPEIKLATAQLQQTLGDVENWCDNMGLSLSVEKSSVVVFACRGAEYQPPVLKISNTPIEVSNSFKFLGVTLDSRLSFNEHINNIVSSCQKRVNILRMLGGTEFGGDRKTLLMLYKSLVRSILEYNSFVFDSACQTSKLKLERIQNAGVRAATGALRETPITSLLTDSGLCPLQTRRDSQLISYYIKVNSTLHHPAKQCFVHPRRIPRIARDRWPPFKHRVAKVLEKRNLAIPETVANPPLFPFWTRKEPKVEYLFTKRKTDFTEEEVTQTFLEYQSENSSKTFIFTDGSKIDEKVGLGVWGQNICLQRRLPDNFSIFTAEAVAIKDSLNIISDQNINSAVICSDSKSVLQAISNVVDPSHHVIADIQRKIDDLPDVTLLWIPGHCNILGNEKADQLAKNSLNKTVVAPLKWSRDDSIALLQSHTRQQIQKDWTDSHSAHLYYIKPNIGYWPSSNQNSRRREVILTRLRNGHCRQNCYGKSGTCGTCDLMENPHHMLIQCPQHDSHRQPMKNYCHAKNVPFDLKILLGNDHPELLELVFKFLSDARLSKFI